MEAEQSISTFYAVSLGPPLWGTATILLIPVIYLSAVIKYSIHSSRTLAPFGAARRYITFAAYLRTGSFATCSLGPPCGGPFGAARRYITQRGESNVY